jgi:chloramphenicol 3-O phosphotransferase
VTSGNIIYLNGTSSAGKTSIVRALQDLLPAPYLDFSLDCFNAMLPARYVAVQPFGQAIPPLAHEGPLLLHELHEGRLRLEMRLGPAGRRFVTSFRHAIRALALTGSNVIVDDVLYEQDFLAECVKVLTGLPVCFVGVHCPPEEASRRERERGDRLLGLAAWQAERIHSWAVYDLEVDTSRARPIECARQIALVVADPPSPSAFEKLRQTLSYT